MNNANEIVDEQLRQLVRGCCEWDRKSQNRLYHLFAPVMFAVCSRYASNRPEAEDALQEGFLKVFENIHTFRFEGSLEGWIRRIMINTVIQKYRQQKHGLQYMETVPEHLIDLSHHVQNDAPSRLGTDELMQLVQQLPPAYRMVFNLYVFEGMKHREIALQLGISEGTSKSNLADARSILQKRIAGFQAESTHYETYERK